MTGTASMIDSQILQPVVVLMAWTMIMWLWIFVMIVD